LISASLGTPQRALDLTAIHSILKYLLPFKSKTKSRLDYILEVDFGFTSFYF